LDRLEANGLIERGRIPHDRRKVIVRATDRAAQWFDGDLEFLSAGFSDRYRALSKHDRESILKSLHQLAAMIDDPSDPSSPTKTAQELDTIAIPLHELVDPRSKASPMHPEGDSNLPTSFPGGKK
jgi:hypothetical protein